MRFFYIFSIFLLIFQIGCKKNPEYPAVPEIEFRSIERFTVFDNFSQTYTDSVNITIHFKDGNGDLGLTDQETQSPYQPYYFILNNNSEYILYGSSDTLPPFDDCNYLIGEFTGAAGLDTVLVQPNQDFFNYFADLYIKNGNTFEIIDLQGICPAPFNGRFPVLSPDATYSGPLDGLLTFNISDPGLRFLVEGKTVKFRIFIKDRALNSSNAIWTSEVIFNY